jgi:hypothetical protein
MIYDCFYGGISNMDKYIKMGLLYVQMDDKRGAGQV